MVIQRDFFDARYAMRHFRLQSDLEMAVTRMLISRVMNRGEFRQLISKN
jgi:hypothetical protein